MATNAALDMAVGKLYVAKHFPPSEKARRSDGQEPDRRDGRAHRSPRLDGAGDEGKGKAKLAVLKVGVGYPDQWRDYSSLQVVAGDALGNAQRAEQFELQRNLAKLGQPVDRGEWVMVPHLVNAVNLPAMNALNFPAAILQPPNFDPSWPDQMNYGAIGSVIGHEISHSFDDQGAMFDATGKITNWWTPDDLKHFQASGARLAAEFDGYKPFPDLHVNGKQTSENIADIAGLYDAYDAYRASLGGKEPPTVQASRAISSSSSASAGVARQRCASRCCARSSSPTVTRQKNIARIPYETSMPGTTRSASKTVRSSWRREIARRSGNARARRSRRSRLTREIVELLERRAGHSIERCSATADKQFDVALVGSAEIAAKLRKAKPAAAIVAVTKLGDVPHASARSTPVPTTRSTRASRRRRWSRASVRSAGVPR